MTKLVKVSENNIVEAVKMMFPHLATVSDSEIMKAVGIAKYLGLDPVKRECHFIPFRGSLQVVVSYTEYIKRAERSNKLNGWDVVVGKDGIDTYAETTIYRKDWQYPLKWRVYLNEVKKDTPSWKSMPIFMLKKTAIAQAFRLAFPEETASLPYEEAEVMSEPAIINEPVKEISKEPEPSKEEAEDEIKYKITEGQIKRLWAITYATAKQYGLSNEVAESIVRSVLSSFGIEHTKDIEKKDYEEIVEKIKKEIEEIAKEGGNEE
ncbi:MAG: recombinase RecT [Sulfurihydrogenibium sp.]|jgi:phage recombination protein Bet|nr:recombinase RecT [Sulfurihydrogenibium sp.]